VAAQGWRVRRVKSRPISPSASPRKFFRAECFDNGDTACPPVAVRAFSAILHAALELIFDTWQKYTIADLDRPASELRTTLGPPTSTLALATRRSVRTD